MKHVLILSFFTLLLLSLQAQTYTTVRLDTLKAKTTGRPTIAMGAGLKFPDNTTQQTSASSIAHDTALTLIRHESDPLFKAHPANTISSANILNWNNAFSWGNHAAVGYLKYESDPGWLTDSSFFASKEYVNGRIGSSGGIAPIDGLLHWDGASYNPYTSITGTSLSITNTSSVSTFNSTDFFNVNGHIIAGSTNTSNNRTGVQGTSWTGFGVAGFSQSSSGIYGASSTSTGVLGTSTNSPGVFGVSTNNVGVSGNGATIGVKGVTSNGIGVYGESNYGIGIEGYSQNHYGVYGHSENNEGIIGVSVNSIGIYGYSPHYTGILGTSITDVAVKGFSESYIGVLGESNTGIGIYGSSANTYGVYGISSNSYGVYGRSFAGISGVFNNELTNSSNIIEARKNGITKFSVDKDGNVNIAAEANYLKNGSPATLDIAASLKRYDATATEDTVISINYHTPNKPAVSIVTDGYNSTGLYVYTNAYGNNNCCNKGVPLIVEGEGNDTVAIFKPQIFPNVIITRNFGIETGGLRGHRGDAIYTNPETNAGSGAHSEMSTSSSNLAGEISFTLGISSLSTGRLVWVGYDGTCYTEAPFVTISSTNSNAAEVLGFYVERTINGFWINNDNYSALSMHAGSSFTWVYHVIQ